MLTGADLLAKVKELGDVSKSDLVRSCGYVSSKKGTTRRRLSAASPCRASIPDVGAMDFQFDATADGRRLKVLNVLDEHSRLCLAIRVGRRCKANDVAAVLEDLTSLYPAPAFIRSDNGPEFIVQALRDWCEASTTTSTATIEPGSP